MFFSVKSRTIIYVFLCLLAVAIIILCIAFKEAKEDVFPTVPTIGESVEEIPLIIIDPGHGGEDPGASANGVTEKEINLSIAKKLKQKIEENGKRAIMSREEDCTTDPNGRFTKSEDLKKRRSLAEENKGDIFISIHMNKFPQEKYKGAQVFYSAAPEESRLLGEAIQTALPEILNDGNKRVAKKSDGKIFILNNVSVPSVIVECGFLSNPEEAENLKNEEYQWRVAEAIYTGIDRFLSKNF